MVGIMLGCSSLSRASSPANCSARWPPSRNATLHRSPRRGRQTRRPAPARALPADHGDATALTREVPGLDHLAHDRLDPLRQPAGQASATRTARQQVRDHPVSRPPTPHQHVDLTARNPEPRRGLVRDRPPDPIRSNPASGPITSAARTAGPTLHQARLVARPRLSTTPPPAQPSAAHATTDDPAVVPASTGCTANPNFHAHDESHPAQMTRQRVKSETGRPSKPGVDRA